MNSSIIAALMAAGGAIVCSRCATLRIRLWLCGAPTWPRLAGELRKMLNPEAEKKFWPAYFRLMQQTSLFAVHRLVFACFALLPVVVFYAILSRIEPILAKSEYSYVSVMPRQRLLVRTGTDLFRLDPAQHALARVDRSIAGVSGGDGEKPIQINPSEKQAFSQCLGRELVLYCLGFEILSRDSLSGVSLLISRPAIAACNPAWPWLSDAEFTFNVVVAIGLGCITVRRRRGA